MYIYHIERRQLCILTLKMYLCRSPRLHLLTRVETSAWLTVSGIAFKDSTSVLDDCGGTAHLNVTE